MRIRPVLIGLLGLLSLLAYCTLTPDSALQPTPPLRSPSSIGQKVSPRPSSTAPPTWTRVPPATPRPSSLRGETPTRTSTPSQTRPPWQPEEIPPITLTPTRSSNVPAAAARDYVAAAYAYAMDEQNAALESVNQALSLVPDHCDFLTLRAQILIALQRTLEAGADLRLALAIDPYHPLARHALAELLADYGRYSSAAAEYGRYLALMPDDAEGWFAVGQILEHMNQPLEAIAAYSQTLSLAPAHADGLARRAALWLEQEGYEAAWSDYSELLALRPSAEAYFARAEVDLVLNAPLLAAADLEAGLALLPPGAENYEQMMQLGQAYLEGGAPLEAAATFSQTLGLTPSLDPYLWLAESHLASGDFGAAITVLNETLPLVSPLQRGRALADRGQAYIGMEAYEEALSDLTEALHYALDTEEQEVILTRRSAAYAGLERFDEAVDDLTDAHCLSANPLLLYRRGIVHQQAGHDQAAASDLAAFLIAADPAETAPELLEDAQDRLADLLEAEQASQSP